MNSGAIRNPDLIRQGRPAVRQPVRGPLRRREAGGGPVQVFARGGRDDTGMEAIGWIKHCVDLGAGEVVVNSIDTDRGSKGL